MNCASVEAILDLFVEGRLTPARAAQIEAHARACADCARKLKPAPASARAAKTAAPEALKARLKAAAARERRGPAAPLETCRAAWAAARERRGPAALLEIRRAAWAAAPMACLGMLSQWAGPGVLTQRDSAGIKRVP